MMSSLSARLLIAVSLVLAVFFGVTVLVLDSVFQRTAERAVEDRLDVQIFLLLAEAEPNPMAGLDLPEDLPEPRFSTAGSGLYGQISGNDGTVIWRSASTIGSEFPITTAGALGEHVFRRTQLADGRPVFLLTLNVEWEFDDGGSAGYQFAVAESLEPFLNQVRRYQRQLYGWFAGLAAALVVTLGLLLRWVLSPLRQLEREISEVESGLQSQLSETWPSELQGLTNNTNRLIRAEHARLDRYRNTLGNLAHSLKTPLAVIRSTIEGGQRDNVEIENQLGRMDEIIGYQLNRAAASGGVTLGNKPVDVSETVAAVVRSLDKVYADKAPLTEVNVSDQSLYFGDSGDLTEIVGNLVDNAYKYCNRQVRVSSQPITVNAGNRPGLHLVIEDDGPGIKPADSESVFGRGVRVDEQADGQGIGLAVVREIVELCGGALEVTQSDLGGTRIAAIFPPA